MHQTHTGAAVQRLYSGSAVRSHYLQGLQRGAGGQSREKRLESGTGEAVGAEVQRLHSATGDQCLQHQRNSCGQRVCVMYDGYDASEKEAVDAFVKKLSVNARIFFYEILYWSTNRRKRGKDRRRITNKAIHHIVSTQHRKQASQHHSR